jgi:hypothetical protein
MADHPLARARHQPSSTKIRDTFVPLTKGYFFFLSLDLLISPGLLPYHGKSRLGGSSQPGFRRQPNLQVYSNIPDSELELVCARVVLRKRTVSGHEACCNRHLAQTFQPPLYLLQPNNCSIFKRVPGDAFMSPHGRLLARPLSLRLFDSLDGGNCLSSDARFWCMIKNQI